MSSTRSPLVKCPVCGSHGETLHHDPRAVLVYSCRTCLHEWQIDPEEEPPEADPAVVERPQTPSARSKPSHDS